MFVYTKIEQFLQGCKGEKQVKYKKMSAWELNGKTSYIWKDEYMRTKRKNKLNIKRWVHENLSEKQVKYKKMSTWENLTEKVSKII